MTNHAYIIAEAGVNHNGSLDLALRLVDAAVSARADAIKFQTFHTEALVSKTAQKAEYQKRNTDADENQYDLLKRLELSDAAHQTLLKHCNEQGIEFLSTPFDIESARFLVTELGLKKLKVSSGDLSNAPFLHNLTRFNVPLILSSGMALLSDIETALSVLAHGFTRTNAPSVENFRSAYLSADGQAMLAQYVSLLHCTSEYPAPFETVNLNSMQTLKSAFGLTTGYSDHTTGISIPIAAAACGAQIIEKHFTLDQAMEGPDHKASLNPSELVEMVRGIRAVEAALGHSQKTPATVEEKTRLVACKGIVAKKAIAAGEVFDENNLAIKRPLGNIAPILWWSLLGRTANKSYQADEPIDNE